MSITNCPNCGAPVVSNKCDYCDTYIFDFSQISMGKACWISVDLGDANKRLIHVILENATMDVNYGENTLYADDRIVDVLRIPDITLDMEFKVVGDDKDGLLAVTKGE